VAKFYWVNKYHSFAPGREVSHCEHFEKIPSLPLAPAIALFQSLPKVHDYRWGSSWQLCGGSNDPVSWPQSHKTYAELRLLCQSVHEPPSSAFGHSLISRKILHLFDMLQRIAACTVFVFWRDIIPRSLLVLVFLPLGRTRLQTDQLDVGNLVHRMNALPPHLPNANRWSSTVAILEFKKLGGALRGQGKSRGANINVHLAWWFFVVLKINLLWLTLLNATQTCVYR